MRTGSSPATRARSAAPTRSNRGSGECLSAAEVVALADAVPARYQAMILLTTFASLRFGEVTALERSDVDLEAGTVRVRRAFVEVRGKGLVAGPAEVACRPADGGHPACGGRRDA